MGMKRALLVRRIGWGIAGFPSPPQNRWIPTWHNTQFPLYPTTKECKWLTRLRDVASYTVAALEERRYAYQRIKRDAGYYDSETRQALTRAYAATFTKQSEQLPGLKEERPEYQEIYSQVLQDVLRRVDAAFDRFF